MGSSNADVRLTIATTAIRLDAFDHPRLGVTNRRTLDSREDVIDDPDLTGYFFAAVRAFLSPYWRYPISFSAVSGVRYCSGCNYYECLMHR